MFASQGARPQWAYIFDRLVKMQVGDVVRHHELRELLPDAPESSVIGAVHTAIKHLEVEKKRSLDNVRGVGYRMVHAAEHENLARKQNKRAHRALKSSRRKIQSADRSMLTPEERRRFDAIDDHLGGLQSMTRRLDERVDRNEKEIKEVRRDQKSDAANLSARLDRLSALMERHGIKSEDADALFTEERARS